MPAAAFEGFGPKALPFLKALDFHQDREWFNQNRKLYETDAREPLKALVEALTERFTAEGIPLKGTPKASLFRINRDVRFSKEKHPYNAHVSAVMTRTGTKKDTGGVYMHFAPEGTRSLGMDGGSFLAAGAWFPEPKVLRAWREDMVDKPKRIFALEDDLAAKDLYFEQDGTKGDLTRLPRGFTKVEDERLQRLLKMKGFVVNRRVDPDRLTSPDLIDYVVAFAKDTLPLNQHYWRIADPLRETND